MTAEKFEKKGVIVVKRRVWIAAMLAFALMLSACGDVTVTVGTSSESTVAEYMGLAVRIISAPEDSNFGLLEDVYTAEGSTTTTLGEVAGDTDVLNPTGIRVTYDSIAVDAIDVLFDAEFPVAFTSKKYTNGVVTDNGGVLELETSGVVEKYNADNTWSRAEFAELHTPGPYRTPGIIQYDYEKDEFPMLKDGALTMALPFKTPGIYRYTLYFRECIDASVENRTTGEELYTLSMIFDIPKSDKLFDVVAVAGLYEYELRRGDYKGEQGYCIATLIRVNTAESFRAHLIAPCHFNEYGMLERLIDDEWTELPGALYTAEPGKGYMLGGPSVLKNRHVQKSIIDCVYFPELTGKYRIHSVLKSGFDKHPETYDMTLNFDFGE